MPTEDNDMFVSSVNILRRQVVILQRPSTIVAVIRERIKLNKNRYITATGLSNTPLQQCHLPSGEYLPHQIRRFSEIGNLSGAMIIVAIISDAIRFIIMKIVKIKI